MNALSARRAVAFIAGSVWTPAFAGVSGLGSDASLSVAHPGFRRVERVGSLRRMGRWNPFFVYMMASGRNGTLYIGMTDDLINRVAQHKNKTFKGFTATYGVDKLVWYETHDTRENAFTRERQMKEWKRAWKIELIEQMNPFWADLFDELTGQSPSLQTSGPRPSPG